MRIRRSRAAVAALAAALLAAGFGLGRATAPAATEIPTGPAASAGSGVASEAPATLPVADVDGTDFSDLPRYPGAVRTRHRVGAEAGSRTRVEYLAVASIDAVRRFYRQVFDDMGWTVVDIDVGYDEHRYLITQSDREGVVDLESRGGGVVEIDLAVKPSLAAVPDASDRAARPSVEKATGSHDAK